MGTSIFLDLTFDRYGQVDGEAVADGYAGQIEVMGFDWGLGRTSSTNTERVSHKAAEKEATSEDVQTILDTGIDPKTGKEVTMKQRFELMKARASFNLLKVGVVAPSAASQVKLKEFKFTKRFDLSSTALLSALNSQDEIKQARFTVLQREPTEKEGISHTPHYVVTLKRGRVNSVILALESAGSGKALVDTVTFGYRGVDIEYFPGAPAGVMTYGYEGPGPGPALGRRA